ncbi:MAG: flavodoxin [Eubacterium sp.]|nr:flavodoxin [Eubacterium sp.]
MACLIAFYSREHENYVNGTIQNLEVGNTEIAAGMLQKLTEGTMFKIEPVQPYAKGYNDCIAQAQSDQRRDARPELKGYPESIDDYDVIYLGFPNYWNTMPMAVFTFLEHFDFSKKTIRPFCTHEGSGMGISEKDIRRLCPEAKIEQGLAIHGGGVAKAEPEIRAWLENFRKDGSIA